MFRARRRYRYPAETVHGRVSSCGRNTEDDNSTDARHHNAVWSRLSCEKRWGRGGEGRGGGIAFANEITLISRYQPLRVPSVRRRWNRKTSDRTNERTNCAVGWKRQSVDAGRRSGLRGNRNATTRPSTVRGAETRSPAERDVPVATADGETYTSRRRRGKRVACIRGDRSAAVRDAQSVFIAVVVCRPFGWHGIHDVRRNKRRRTNDCRRYRRRRYLVLSARNISITTIVNRRRLAAARRRGRLTSISIRARVSSATTRNWPSVRLRWPRGAYPYSSFRGAHVRVGSPRRGFSSVPFFPSRPFGRDRWRRLNRPPTTCRSCGNNCSLGFFFFFHYFLIHFVTIVIANRPPSPLVS